LIISSISIIVLKVPYYDECCPCPPENYKLYPFLLSACEIILEKLSILPREACLCALEVGCSFSFYIIPIDLITLAFFVFAIIYIKCRKG